jgi:hypothetical protein
LKAAHEFVSQFAGRGMERLGRFFGAPQAHLDQEGAAVSSRRPAETRYDKLFQVKWLARKARWRSLKSAARLENHGKY